MKTLLYHDASQLAGVGHRDRLVTAAFFVLLLHGVLILGLTFSTDAAPPGDTTIKVTLARGPATDAPEHAEYVAQINQRGHGNTERRVNPRSPVATSADAARTGAAAGRDPSDRAAPGKSASRVATQDRDADSARNRVVTTRGDAARAYADGRRGSVASDAPRRLVARLVTPADAAVGEAARRALAHDENPRDRLISVNTRESRFARYLDNWRKHVVRLGNLNFPAAVRARGLSGHLTLEVALNADGSLRAVVPVKPSRHPELNAAAIRIVQLGAPYQPFPPAIRKDTDILRFVYEWRFINGHLAGAPPAQ